MKLSSWPCIAAYHYMLTGSVSKQHPDWMVYMVYKLTEIPRCACNHKPLAVGAEGELEDGTEQASVWPVCSQVAVDDSFEGLNLHHGFRFQNAMWASSRVGVALIFARTQPHPVFPAGTKWSPGRGTEYGAKVSAVGYNYSTDSLCYPLPSNYGLICTHII